MTTIHYPPVSPFVENGSVKLFLAGTIDMGLSVNWQELMIDYLKAYTNGNLNIFNPRRKDWNSSWPQSPNHVMFRAQVDWELKHQEIADLILMVFLEGSKSPISLMELGSFKNKPLMVFCPEGFYRFGNVEIFCRRYNIETFQDWDDYLIAVRRKVNSYINKIC